MATSASQPRRTRRGAGDAVWRAWMADLGAHARRVREFLGLT
jgi:hypothetical protein